MCKLDSESLKKFVELMKEEHTINDSIIPTIYDILLEATGYVERTTIHQSDCVPLSKKERVLLRSKQRDVKRTNMYSSA